MIPTRIGFVVGEFALVGYDGSGPEVVFLFQGSNQVAKGAYTRKLLEVKDFLDHSGTLVASKPLVNEQVSVLQQIRLWNGCSLKFRYDPQFSYHNAKLAALPVEGSTRLSLVRCGEFCTIYHNATGHVKYRPLLKVKMSYD